MDVPRPVGKLDYMDYLRRRKQKRIQMGRGGGSRFVGSKVEEAECEYDQTMCQEFLKILIRYIKTKKQLSYSRKNDMKMCS